MTQANDERAARKEYIRRRQKTVFSIVGAVMVVAMVVSLLFFFHVGGLGNVKSAAVQPNYGQQAPCPIKEADGSKAKYVENRNITLRVLNGTKFSGFAKAVSDALQNREFNPQTPDNYTKKVDRTMIVFGKNGVNQAYTVASNFTDAMLVMDDRQDQLIDVIVGATFDNPSTLFHACGETTACQSLFALLLVPAFQLGNGHVTLHRTVIEAVFQHVLVRLADHRAWFDT